jgi:hypothetical protein
MAKAVAPMCHRHGTLLCSLDALTVSSFVSQRESGPIGSRAFKYSDVDDGALVVLPIGLGLRDRILAPPFIEGPP